MSVRTKTAGGAGAPTRKIVRYIVIGVGHIDVAYYVYRCSFVRRVP